MPLRPSALLAPIAALSLLALTSCGEQKQPAAPANPPAAPNLPLTTAIPALDTLPADTDFALILNNPAALADRFLSSRLLRELLFLPFLREPAAQAGYTGDPQRWLRDILEQEPRLKRYHDLARDTAGAEVVIALPKGTAAQLSLWLGLIEEIQAAQLLAAVIPALENPSLPDPAASPALPDPAASQTRLARTLARRLAPIVEQLHPPALLLAVKPGPDGRAWLERRAASLLGDLPENTTRGEITAAGTAFQTAETTLGALLPPAQTGALRQQLATLTGDATLAPEVPALLDTLLAKKITIAHGWPAGRFLLAAGSPATVRATLAALSEPATLGSRPELAPFNEFADKNPFALLYQSRDFVEACRPRLGLAPLAEAFKDALPEGFAADAAALDSLLDSARRLDDSHQNALTGPATANTGIAFLDSGIRIESRGGLPSPLLAAPQPLKTAGFPAAGTALWLAAHDNPEGSARLTAFIEDICATAVTTFKTLFLPRLPEHDQRNYATFESLLFPRVQTLWDIGKDLFTKALGPESGLFLDLQEPLPLAEGLPEELRGEARAPHFALFYAVRDPQILSTIWPRLMTWANDLTLLAPIPGVERPLPEPESRSAEPGAASWFYRIPGCSPTDAPGVTIAGGFWFLGTSITAQERLARAIQNPPPSAAPASSALEIRSKPIVTAIKDFITVLEKTAPSTEPSQPASPSQNLRAAADLLGRLESIQYRRSETPEGPAEHLWIRLAP